jgi:hypothetical protein
MSLQERINAFIALGKYLSQLPADELEHLARRAQNKNGWFTLPNIRFALKSWGEQLQAENLERWLAAYPLPDAPAQPKKVGVVMAGNIPLVGFHDLLCVLLSGHVLYAKPSSGDPLPEFIAQQLLALEPRFAGQLQFSEMLKDMDAYIATGSDNTARYFEYYFRNKPHLIRKNRSSCALLTGRETDEQLKGLGRDMLQYWGLGCRSVSKLYVPQGYAFPRLFESLESWADVQDHHKWVNNYDYHKSIYLVNGDAHLDNGFLLLRESEGLGSPVSVVFYEYYGDEQALEAKLMEQKDRLQCIVGPAELPADTPFGQAQRPALWDYADGIDTLSFLINL